MEQPPRWVIITGLQSANGLQMNGRVGQVTGPPDEQHGRVPVKVDGQSQSVLLKPENTNDIPEEGLVKVVRLHSAGETIAGVFSGPLSEVRYPRAHSMFRGVTNQGNCPALALCGINVIVAKTEPVIPFNDRGDYDCTWATRMKIEPDSGFAPMQWQQYVGPCLVYRPDGQDFSVDDADIIHDFLGMVLDCYGDGPEFDPSTMLNVENFQSHKRECMEFRPSLSDVNI